MTQLTIDGHTYEFALDDYGTVDTVIEVTDITTGKTVTWTYSDTAEYRNAYGELDLDHFCEDVVGPQASYHDWNDEPTSDDWTEEETLAALNRAIDDCLEANVE